MLSGFGTILDTSVVVSELLQYLSYRVATVSHSDGISRRVRLC